ncbi:MAG TPA: hypothetical protein VII56_09370 [Rhizomicrobium sp.]
MLFDRLVFPVPETGKFPQDSGPPDAQGPVAWNAEPTEWARWEQKKWDPAAQSEILDLLGPLARRVPWQSAGEKGDPYRAEATRLAAQGIPDYAFVATRTLLTRDLPASVEGVAAMGPSYSSYAEFERECGDPTAASAKTLPGKTLATVLASEFFVPDVSDLRLSAKELLSETVSFVTGDADFRKRRSAFNAWQQNFIRNGATDAESIRRAVEEMRELVEASNAAAGKLKIRKVVQNIFRLAPCVVAIGAAVTGHPLAFAGAEVGLMVGSFVVDEKLFKSAENQEYAPTAFVRDARRHFGWQDVKKKH